MAKRTVISRYFRALSCSPAAAALSLAAIPVALHATAGLGNATGQHSRNAARGARNKESRSEGQPSGSAVNGQAPGEARQRVTLNRPPSTPGCIRSRGSSFGPLKTLILGGPRRG